MLDPLLFNLFVLIVSMVLVFKSADYIVYGISRYARKLGFSDALAGLLVVSLAASMPELIASLTGLVLGYEEVLLGTIFGTNLVHLALVVGSLAIVGKKIKLDGELLGKSAILLWLILLVPFILMLVDRELGRADGIILLALYAMYLGWLWLREGHLKKSVLVRTIWRDALIFLFSLIALLLSARWLVGSSVNMAAILGIPAYFISITVLAFGGALPDFAVGLRSIWRGHQNVGLGDVLGSVVLELLLFLGLVGLLHPIKIPVGAIPVMGFLVLALTYVLWLMQRKQMTWKHGLVLVAMYAVFISIEIWKLV